MQTIGLIGGMSYESTITYYQQINKFINSKLGKMHSAKCIIYSVDFEQIAQCQREDNWEQASKILTEAALSLQKAGADFIVICTNTMHKVVPTIQANINLPILHIAKVTANTLIEHNITKVGLLGTKYTMQLDFYKDILKQKGIEVICPEIKDMDIVNKIIEIAKRNKKMIFTADFENPVVYKDDYFYRELSDVLGEVKLHFDNKGNPDSDWKD